MAIGILITPLRSVQPIRGGPSGVVGSESYPVPAPDTSFPPQRSHLLATAHPDPVTGSVTVKVEVSDSSNPAATFDQEWTFTRDDVQALQRIRQSLVAPTRDQAQLSGLGFTNDPASKSVLHYVDWEVPGRGSGKLTLFVAAQGE
jgi:hypothetical protein